MTSQSLDVAIVGAGMAGLSCAQSLRAAGYGVTLFDKGRGPGGRMATRRVDIDGETVRFDHGAQYFKALDSNFAAQCEEWQDQGVVAHWPPAGKQALVGAPSMNAIIRHMAEPFEVHWGTRIEQVEWLAADNKWILTSDDGRAEFDAVVCAIPAEQAAELLYGYAPGFASTAQAVGSSPSWAAMAVFEQPIDLPDCAEGDALDDIVWAARNASKPGREGGEAWVIHASTGFSRSILDLTKEEAAEQILAAFVSQTGIVRPEVKYLTAHRWLYAFPESHAGDGFLWDHEHKIGVCGDWLVAPNVEGAWLSGQSLAAAMVDKAG